MTYLLYLIIKKRTAYNANTVSKQIFSNIDDEDVSFFAFFLLENYYSTVFLDNCLL